ncbi:MFS transporter [Microbacterium gilvum]|uniref:MFS transporter n=1 Tax=Microbacterium gilvum TaxID=1336204 RepID=A0ABP8ZWC2_9MICO
MAADTNSVSVQARSRSERASSIPRRAFGFGLAGLASTIMMIGASAPSPFYPHLQEQLGIGAFGVTIAFAVYAVALLIALLTVGSISDHLGRRPIIFIGYLLLAGAILLVWRADTGTMLYLGRSMQGIASGALISTISATIVDFAPPHRPKAATLLNSIAPMTGLAVGTLYAGALLEAAGPAAATATFVPLAFAYLIVAALIWATPETSPREAGWRRALRPRVAVPRAAARLFGISVPIILAGWATGGLFLSLGPSIVHAELRVNSSLAQGLVIGALPATGAIAAFVMRNRRPLVNAVYGASALAVGTLLMLIALAVGSLPLYIVAVVIAGTGFGTAFSGTVGSIMPFAAVHERAELFASLYIVAYLSFGVPAVIAGALASTIGLHTAVLAFGAGVALAAGIAAIIRARTGTPTTPPRTMRHLGPSS